jgi:hypothetical protein
MKRGNGREVMQRIFAAMAGAVSVFSLIIVLRESAAMDAGCGTALGLAFAVWLLVFGAFGALGARRGQSAPLLTGTVALACLALLGAAATPLAIDWAQGSAWLFWAAPVASIPSAAACGFLLARVWLHGAPEDKRENVYIAGAVGAAVGGVVYVATSFAWPGPGLAFDPVAASQFITKLADLLSGKDFSTWLMPGSGIVAALLAVAFGGGRGQARPVGLAAVLGGCLQGAVALALVISARDFWFPGFRLPALILAVQAGGLAFGVFAVAKIKVPALWVLAPLHGALCFMAGAALPTMAMIAPQRAAAYLVWSLHVLAALAIAVPGGMHFALAARGAGGGLTPDNKAAGLYLGALAGGAFAAAALTLFMVPALGLVLSLKALALASAGGVAALLLAVNRGMGSKR